MAMRFLIVSADYPEFLCWFYTQHRGLESQPYAEQMQRRAESLFGVSNFYSSNLRKLGHEAWHVHFNNECIQKAWAREHGVRVEEKPGRQQYIRAVLRRLRRAAAKTPLRHLAPFVKPILCYAASQPSWPYEILAAQIKHYKPDVLLNQAMVSIRSRFLHEMKPYIRLLVGQIATPFQKKEDFDFYDLVTSSLPNLVEYFRKRGIPSEFNKLAFEPSVLRRLGKAEEKTPVSFVGSLFLHRPYHETRIQLLEYLCERLDIQVWGNGVGSVAEESPIRRHCMGQAWGIEMYRVLRNSKITLNHHGGISGPYANNCRLYEATGVGALLLTDWKQNLREMFDVGREVIAYRDPEECAELIRYYLEHDDEREAIARAGQKATLRRHTYYQRMQELADIAHRHLAKC